MIALLVSSSFVPEAKPENLRSKIERWSVEIEQTNLELEGTNLHSETTDYDSLIIVIDTSANSRTPVSFTGWLLAGSYILPSVVEKYPNIKELVILDSDGHTAASYSSDYSFSEEQRLRIKEGLSEFHKYYYVSGGNPYIGVRKAIHLMEEEMAGMKVSILLIGDTSVDLTSQEKTVFSQVMEKVRNDGSIKISCLYLEFRPFTRESTKRKNWARRYHTLHNRDYIHQRKFVEESLEATRESGGYFYRVSLSADSNPSEKYRKLTRYKYFKTYNYEERIR